MDPRADLVPEAEDEEVQREARLVEVTGATSGDEVIEERVVVEGIELVLGTGAER